MEATPAAEHYFLNNLINYSLIYLCANVSLYQYLIDPRRLLISIIFESLKIANYKVNFISITAVITLRLKEFSNLGHYRINLPPYQF